MDSVWDQERDYQNIQANRQEGNHDYAPHCEVAVPAARRDKELSCITHHFACDCREQKVREMCEYLLAFDKSSNDGDVDTEWDSLEAAIDIAHDLYGEAPREDHHDA